MALHLEETSWVRAKPEHVKLLKEKPSFAPKFDQVYGEGVAEEILNEDAALMVSDTYREGDVAPPMFPDSGGGARPNNISPLDLGKIGAEGAAGADDSEASNSPRTVKWRKENETRAAMGLKPKPHPSKKK